MSKNGNGKSWVVTWGHNGNKVRRICNTQDEVRAAQDQARAAGMTSHVKVNRQNGDNARRNRATHRVSRHRAAFAR